MIWHTTWIVIAASLALAACKSDPDGNVFGPPTETPCPTGSTLTYDNFGRDFMESYCTECHDSKLAGTDRQGAPSFHDFDTRFGVKGVANHIDETSAAGPAAINTGMPPSGHPKPTEEERFLLGEWIACGVP